jgi:transcriptional regulator GlxA family with amidase domain
MHRVAVAAFDGVVPFDLATPCEVFGRVRLADESAPYRVRVCGAKRRVDAGAFELGAPWGLGELVRADTVIVPGVADTSVPVPRELVLALRRAAAKRVRIASICSGAFVLAAAGLLDGLRATTHWLAASELARRYPSITVEPDVLYVDHGAIATSAGAAAGLDLCLHLVRRDFGAAVAAATARVSVMPLEREGGQQQFIVHEDPAPDGASLDHLLHWIEKNLRAPLSLAHVARRAAMSTRTFSRRFHEQTGTTPAQYVLARRVRRAQHFLETTAHSIDRIAGEVGFGSTATFRDRFHRLVGTSPQAYRRAFRAKAGRG